MAKNRGVEQPDGGTVGVSMAMKVPGGPQYSSVEVVLWASVPLAPGESTVDGLARVRQDVSKAMYGDGIGDVETLKAESSRFGKSSR